MRRTDPTFPRLKRAALPHPAPRKREGGGKAWEEERKDRRTIVVGAGEKTGPMLNERGLKGEKRFCKRKGRAINGDLACALGGKGKAYDISGGKRREEKETNWGRQRGGGGWGYLESTWGEMASGSIAFGDPSKGSEGRGRWQEISLGLKKTKMASPIPKEKLAGRRHILRRGKKNG